ncbi:MAG: DUF4129 domain-containing protein [Verrucomicrobiota bacterium]
MELEKLTAVIRPRSDWEAVDLGWALTRRHFGLIQRFWLLSVVPIWALILGVFHNRLDLAIVLIWWLKPIYERVPLFVLSHSLFGHPPRTGEFLRSAFRLLFRGLLMDLLIRRFTAQRTLVMSVSQLEGLRGRKFFDRAAVLSLRSGGTAFVMQIVCLLFLHSIWLGIIVLVYFMIPPQYQPHIDFFGGGGIVETVREAPSFFVWTWIGLYLTALSLITPFFVGGGFGLYLNTRTEIEGWDVEIAFRRLGSRLQKALPILVLILTLGICPAMAENGTENPADPKDVIMSVLADDDFEIRTTTRWRHQPESEKERDLGWLSLDWVWNGTAGLAALIRLGLIVAGIAFILVLLIRIARLGIRNVEAPALPKAKTVMGMNVRRESLPRDVVGKARNLWEANDRQGAISMLYRGAISWMINQGSVPIQESDTEHECLERSRLASADAQANYFAKLTRVWVALAYGKRVPSGSEAGELFESWPFEFNQGKGAK